MRKLLSLVLSVSIWMSSITPALGQIVPAGRGVVQGMRRGVGSVAAQKALSAQVTRRVLQGVATSPLHARILSGNVQGLAQHILQQPVAQRAPVLRNEFITLSLLPGAVTPAQRIQAVQAYQAQLKNTKEILSKTFSLNAFLNWAKETPNAEHVVTVRNILADASALGLVGTKEEAPALVDFYKQAQGTVFEDTAALITARGLLRMQAYDALTELFAQATPTETLAGTVAYIRMKGLPVEIPSTFNQIPSQQAADPRLAAFLGQGFMPNRLHADTSLTATEQWVNISAPQMAQPAVATPQGIAAKKTTPVSPVTQETAAQVAPAQDPVASAQTVPAQTGTTAPVAKVAAPVAQSTHSRSGILYSGIPVFAMADALERFGTWVRRQLKQRVPEKIPYEEPGLHESSVRPVFAQVEMPAKASVGGDLLGVDEVQEVSVGVDGFKLTVEGEDKVEHILRNVDLTVSSSLKNFSTQYNRLTLDTNHIFELRNQTIPAKRPDHFYFALATQNGELNALLEGARQLNLTRPLRIKIQHTGAPKKTVTLPVYDKNLQEPPVILAEVDTSLLSGIKEAEKGHIWYYNGALHFRSPEGELTELENAFVRLPKAESKYWTQILNMFPNTQFKLGVFSTMEKMVPVTYLVPSLQIGLGKTMSPVLNDMSTLGETASSSIMLGINNVLPALMGFVHPFLKQYGEAAVFRVGASMFTAGGLIALASGLYGHVGAEMMTNLQLAGFLASSVLIALGTNITRFVQNLLMSANRGIVPQTNSFQKQKEVADVTAPAQVYNAKFLAKRGWEVLTKKSKKSLRDIVFYQRGAMFKNLGTMLFLSFPWLANMAGKALGYDLGLDFSASYVPYSIYSLYTLRKVYQTRYKDAFPLNQTVLQNNLQDVAQAATLEIYKVAPAELTAEHPVVVQAAKKIKTAIDALTPVEARKTKTTINTLTAKHEEEIGEELENMLKLAQDRTPEQARSARTALQHAFDQLGHRNVKLTDVMFMAGLPMSLTAMTLATMGELGLSNGLAFAMRELVGNGTAATGIVGILLYGCMFGWRIVGNVLSQRMSGGSMYALSSMASISGPMMMSMAGSNVAMLATGAIIACFGVSNFFSQMYEYMVGLHPKYKREIALLINYTMPAAAVPAALLRKVVEVSGVSGLDIGIAGVALAASVALTPGMLANSSMVQAGKYAWQQLKNKLHRFFHRGGDVPPIAEVPAN